MKVILLQSVPYLGQRNDVKEVKEGYARNFLFPRKLAKPADAVSIATVANQKLSETARKSEEQAEHQEIASRLLEAKLYFKRKASEKGTTFGSVSREDVAAALAKQHLAIRAEWIELPEPIKQIGEQTISIRFASGIQGSVTIIVEPEEK